MQIPFKTRCRDILTMLPAFFSNQTNRAINITLICLGILISFQIYELGKFNFYLHLLIHFYSNLHFNILQGFNFMRSTVQFTWQTQVTIPFGFITRQMRFTNHIVRRMRCTDHITKFSFHISRQMRCKDHITRLIRLM